MRLRDDDVSCCTQEFWIFLAICLALVSFAGITSGLALGLLSFGQVDLEVLIKAGQPHESKYAVKILPLVKNEHLLLCTLLLAKSLAMEALPIFLDSILPFWAAILMSVTLALAFAEIIPQAVCSRYGLQLGARLAFLVRLLLLIFFPISYPISKVLDWLLGRAHSALYRRSELKTLVDLHANEAGKGGELTHHETTIIAGALELTEKTAKDAMTPISETFSLDINSKLNMVTMGLIMSKGHSRVPIYSGNPNNIVGLILVKNLIFCRPEEETPIKHTTIRKIPRVYEDWPLYEILNLFQEGHSHMAIVLKRAPRDNTSKSLLTGFSTHMSPLYHSIDLESPSRNCTDVEERSREMNRRQWLGSGTFSHKDLESLPSFSGEEVIGIITMEDVMEELLQKEILDETDEYVDLHNKIRINLPSSRRSSSSPARVSISRHQCKTQELSRLSSTAPILYAQISPAPDSSPTNTPGHVSISSAGPIGKSLLSQGHKASRKMNKKLDPVDP